MGSTISTAQWLDAGVHVVLPILVALVTARAADGWVKAITLLVLSTISSFLVEWLAAGAAFDFDQAMFMAVTGFVISVASHFGLWKPAAVTGSEGVVQYVLPGGVGGRRHAA